ncbi:Amastin surface glycoprotein [Trypanosoma melophagium]|uniref:Amastin surface glycoprotein n=1 Tax=Trypanosoma melophagium TaxID=715481 RepID=UPI00351A2368|nr:Amastin surface glycoprotein [Trypanosoma melophagium]
MRSFILFSKLLLFLIFQTVVFILILIATPLDVFSSRGMGSCYGLFGRKRCGGFGGAVTSSSWGCSRRHATMNAAAAFAIISIFLSCGATVMAFLMYFHIYYPRLILFILSLLTAITILICWACVATVYNESLCASENGFGASHSYGPGFGLTVFTWILQVFTAILSGMITF